MRRRLRIRRRRQQPVKRKAVKAGVSEDQLALPALDGAIAESKAIRCLVCGHFARLIADTIPRGWNRSPSVCPTCLDTYRGQGKPNCPFCSGSGVDHADLVNDPTFNYAVPLDCRCKSL